MLFWPQAAGGSPPPRPLQPLVPPVLPLQNLQLLLQQLELQVVRKPESKELVWSFPRFLPSFLTDLAYSPSWCFSSSVPTFPAFLSPFGEQFMSTPESMKSSIVLWKETSWLWLLQPPKSLLESLSWTEVNIKCLNGEDQHCLWLQTTVKMNYLT